MDEGEFKNEAKRHHSYVISAKARIQDIETDPGFRIFVRNDNAANSLSQGKFENQKTEKKYSRSDKEDLKYSYRWKKARIEFLEHNPFCWSCYQKGRIIKATIVDHKIPHKNDSDLFWDPGLLFLFLS